MIELAVTPADYRRIRFAFSPVAELVNSVRTLSLGRRNGLHGPWLSTVRLDGVDLPLLTALVRPTGYVPDFLLPSPVGRTTTVDDGLAALGTADPGLVVTELTHLAQHEIAQRGPGRAARTAILRDLIADPAAALTRITTEFERYWHAAIAPHWPRITALLEADLAHRMTELAAGGVARLFRTLHPSVALHGDVISIVKYYEGRAELRERGLILVPCAFVWPDVLVRTADPVPSLTYSPRGLGTLWEPSDHTEDAPLAAVVGRTRAAVLALLELPMSATQLAAQLALAAPTLTVHLKSLQAAGIVTAQRSGRAVLYHRTGLGDALVTGQKE